MVKIDATADSDRGREGSSSVSRFRADGALLALAAVAVVGANVLLPGYRTALFFNVCFWLLLSMLLRAHGVGWRDCRYFLPLPLLYYVTFALQRDVASRYDLVLGADAALYVEKAASLAVGVRHAGYPIFTWAHTTVTDIGELVGLEQLGIEFLYLQFAIIGGLAVVLLYTLLQDCGANAWKSLAIAYAFGLSFSVWMLAGIVDTQIVSTMLLLLFLSSIGRYLRRPAGVGDWFAPCAISLLAATMSLEALYMPLLFAIAWLARGGRKSVRDLIDPVAYALTLLLLLGVLIAAAAAVTGVDFYAVDINRRRPTEDLVTHLQRFEARYVDVGAGLAPAAAAATTFQVLVMAVRAQPGVPIDRYRFSPGLLRDPVNWLYALLMAALASLAYAGLRSPHLRVRGFEWVLIGGLVSRHLFVMVYDRQESVLFSLPSLVFMWLLLGIGIGSAPLGQRRTRWLVGVLTVLLVLLVWSNGMYVLDIPTR